MELLYVYIDKYRNFSKQGISFSNKFKVEYLEEEKELKITRNENYIEMYPKNIVGINALLGKNASGKTSLLDLIGKRIESRHYENEIEFVSQYFLLYYIGKSEENKDLFVFETCDITKYGDFFKKEEHLNENDFSYYIDKGWFSGVCNYVNNKLQFCENTTFYKFKGDKSLDKDSAIILFKQKFNSDFYLESMKSEDEFYMSVKRRSSLLQNDFVFKEIKFLIEQMNEDENNLFKESEYNLEVEFKNIKPKFHKDFSFDIKKVSKKSDEFDFDKIVKDYEDFEKQNFSEKEEFTLLFIYHFIGYGFDKIVSLKKEINSKQKECIEALKNINSNFDSYEGIKRYYNDQLKIIFDYLDNPNVTIKEFIKTEESIENLFDKEKECDIDITYTENKINIIFNKNSKFDEIEDFFTNCIDGYKHKDLNSIDSVMQEFISTDIKFLSDGEQANLSFFTVIDEQIRIHTETKKNYILLFDEIERSMHPEMCRNLISDLIIFLSQYEAKTFHIILASHSPFIASDIVKENINCLKYNEDTLSIDVSKPENNTFGQNIHTILRNEFFLENTIGEFSKKRIIEIAKWLESEEESEEKVNGIIDKINNSLSKSKKVVNNLEEAYVYLDHCISCVGEPIIRNHLQELLNKKFNENKTIDEEIKFHQKELEKLKQRKRDL